MNRHGLLKLIITFMVSIICLVAFAPDTSAATPKTNSWTMTGLLKDWLITPHDLAINGTEIYVSSYMDNRVAVLNLDGQILRYYTLEKNPGFDNVCVAVTSRGQVMAASSKGVWELKPDGTTGELVRFNLSTLDYMTIGPDDSIYISDPSNGRSRILKISLNGATNDLVTIDSDRISDMDFDSQGNLFMADAQHGHGQILKYSQAQGVEIFASGFSDPSGGGPFYLAFDQAGRLYTSSVAHGLALVSADGTVTTLEPFNISGDLFFHDGLLYTLDIYTSTLYEIEVDNTTILSKRILLEGSLPWYIDHQGEIIVGERITSLGRRFFNYDINHPGLVEPNTLLNALQPNQYTFDDSGNMYLLFGSVLKKMDSTGEEEFSVSLPGQFQWDTHLFYNPADDKIYYFDESSNRVIRANAQGAETYHRFSSTVSRAYLSVTREGKVYAGVISSDGAKLVDISDPAEERVVWRPNTTFDIYLFPLGSDAKGNLYAALGPAFQQVFCIDPVEGTAVSMVDESTSRYDWGFVDPGDLTVTDSGTVVVCADVLVAFIPDTLITNAPQNVVASDGTYVDKVALTWSAVSGARSYEIWRHTSNNSGTAVKISSPDLTGTNYDDTNAATGTTYYYWMKAVNAAGAGIFSASDSGYVGVVGPLITANGLLGDVNLNSGDPVSIAVQMMNMDSYVGVEVDWWVVARAGSSWYYLNSAVQWTPEGNMPNWHPVNQGPLFNLPATEVLNITGLQTGSYTFWFAIDLPMDGILNLDGQILVDSVNVNVQ